MADAGTISRVRIVALARPVTWLAFASAGLWWFGPAHLPIVGGALLATVMGAMLTLAHRLAGSGHERLVRRGVVFAALAVPAYMARSFWPGVFWNDHWAVLWHAACLIGVAMTLHAVRRACKGAMVWNAERAARQAVLAACVAWPVVTIGVAVFAAYSWEYSNARMEVRQWVWLASAGATVVALVPIARALAASRHMARAMLVTSNCRSCGYDLRGIPGSQCPECGMPIDLAQRHAEEMPRLGTPWGPIVTLGLIALLSGAWGWFSTPNNGMSRWKPEWMLVQSSLNTSPFLSQNSFLPDEIELLNRANSGTLSRVTVEQLLAITLANGADRGHADFPAFALYSAFKGGLLTSRDIASLIRVSRRWGLDAATLGSDGRLLCFVRRLSMSYGPGNLLDESLSSATADEAEVLTITSVRIDDEELVTSPIVRRFGEPDEDDLGSECARLDVPVRDAKRFVGKHRVTIRGRVEYQPDTKKLDANTVAAFGRVGLDTPFLIELDGELRIRR